MSLRFDRKPTCAYILNRSTFYCTWHVILTRDTTYVYDMSWSLPQAMADVQT